MGRQFTAASSGQVLIDTVRVIHNLAQWTELSLSFYDSFAAGRNEYIENNAGGTLHFMRVVTTPRFEVGINTGGWKIITGTVVPTTGIWWLHCGTFDEARVNELNQFDGNAALAVALDGAIPANQGTHTMTGAAFGRDPAAGSGMEGKMCNCSLWNVVISTVMLQAILNGVPPLIIRDQSIVYYSPYWGNNSPESDYSGNGRLGVLTDTAKTSHFPCELLENYL